MLKKDIKLLKISRDREIELKIENLIKPNKPSKIWLIFTSILWWLGVIICIPLMLFPIGWVVCILIVCGLIYLKPSKSEVAVKYDKEMSDYHKEVKNISHQIKRKYNKLIQLDMDKEKEDAIASKLGLSVKQYRKKEAEKKAEETAQTVKQKAEEMRIRKQKAKEIFASWSIGTKEDILLAEAAKIVIQEQSGSTSLIQRKLRIGYNKASSIIDKLEAAGIITPYAHEGSRKVVFTDLIDLYE